MTTRKHQIDWLNHGLEFIVVIIGILIAFQLEKCNTNRQNQKTVEVHLNGIVQESEQNKEILNAFIDVLQSNQKRLDTILTYAPQHKAYSSINRNALHLLNSGKIFFFENAYHVLQESGDIKLIKDFDHKKDIIELYNFYDWVKGFDEIAIDLFRNDYYPYLNANFDLNSGKIVEEEIYQSQKFINLVAAYKRADEQRLNKAKECVSKIETYLAKYGK